MSYMSTYDIRQSFDNLPECVTLATYESQKISMTS